MSHLPACCTVGSASFYGNCATEKAYKEIHFMKKMQPSHTWLHFKNQVCDVCRCLINSLVFIWIPHLPFPALNLLLLFQILRPNMSYVLLQILEPWAERISCHEMIHKGAVKESCSLYGPSTLTEAPSSFNYLHVCRIVRGHRSHSAEITAESTAAKWILMCSSLQLPKMQLLLISENTAPPSTGHTGSRMKMLPLNTGY